MSLVGAKLISLDEKGAHGETIRAKGRKFTIGYYMACDHILTDSNANGLHCEINCDAFGRVTIHNFSEDHPVSVNDKAIKIKRPLLNGSKINILGKSYLWDFPKVASSECEDLNSDTLSTPQKQVGIPEQPPNSCPNLMLHRDIQRRFTVHNFAYCIQSDDEGNSTIDSTTSESIEIADTALTPETSSCPTNTVPVLVPAMEEAGMEERSNTPNSNVARNQEETPKINLINFTQNKENTNSQKKRNHLSFCQQSDIVITSFSPRETGVRIEKSFTAILKPATPRSVYSTPKSILYESNDDDGSRDFIDFSTPATSKKSMKHTVSSSSMHLIDLTTPGKLKVVAAPATASPHVKSSLKGASKNNMPATSEMSTLQESGVNLLETPVVDDVDGKSKDAPDSVISINSTDSSSVVELSEDSLSPSPAPAKAVASAVTFNVTPKKPKTITTPKRTPHPLMKRAILTSAKKQCIISERKEASVSRASKASTTTGQIITLSPAATPKNVANRQLLARRQSLSTPGQRVVVKSRLYGSPRSPNTAAKSTPQLNRSSLIHSAGRTLSTSTPLRSSGVAQRAAAKTSPLLHKVRKSIGGAPLSSHISKIRKTLDLSNKSSPLETSASTSAKFQHKSVFIPSPANARARAMAAASIIKNKKTTLEQKKAIPPPPDEKIVSEETNELSRTFTLDDTDKETKNATFSPVKGDVAGKEEVVEEKLVVEEDAKIPEKPKIEEITESVADEVLPENAILEKNIVSEEAVKDNVAVEEDVVVEENVVVKEEVSVSVLNVTFSPEKPYITEITESVADGVLAENILEENNTSEDAAFKEGTPTEETQESKTICHTTSETVKQTENLNKDVESSIISKVDAKEDLVEIISDSEENNLIYANLSQPVSDSDDLLSQIDDVLNKSDELKKNSGEVCVCPPAHLEDASNSNQMQNTEDATKQNVLDELDNLEEINQLQQEDVIVIEEDIKERSVESQNDIQELQQRCSLQKNLDVNSAELQEIKSSLTLETEKVNKLQQGENTVAEEDVLVLKVDLDENLGEEKIPEPLETDKRNNGDEAQKLGDKPEFSPKHVGTVDVHIAKTFNADIQEIAAHSPNHAGSGEAQSEVVTIKHTTKESPIIILSDKTQLEIEKEDIKVLSLKEVSGDQPEISMKTNTVESNFANKNEDIELLSLQRASGDQLDSINKTSKQKIEKTSGSTLTHKAQVEIKKVDMKLLSSAELSGDLPESTKKTTKHMVEDTPVVSHVLEKTQLKQIEIEDIELTSFKEAVKKASVQPRTPNLRGIKDMLRTPKRQTDCDIEHYEGLSALLKTPSTAKKTRNVTETTKNETEPQTFTPRRSARRASMSATESCITLTPKRITKRRASISVDTELTINTTPKQKKTPMKKRTTLFEKTLDDMGVIAEEIPTCSVPNRDQEVEVSKIESNNEIEQKAKEAKQNVPSSTDELQATVLLEESICEVLPNTKIQLSADNSTAHTIEVKLADSKVAINDVDGEGLEDHSIGEVVNDAITSDIHVSEIALETILPENRVAKSKCDVLDPADYSYGEEVKTVQNEVHNQPTSIEAKTPKKSNKITIPDSTHSPLKSEDNIKEQLDEKEDTTKKSKLDLNLKIKDDFDQEQPCTSKSAKLELNRMNLKAPKSCSTPRALKKPAVTSTPVLGGETPTRSVARSLIERGLLPRPENLSSMSVELNKTVDESLDKIFRTPRAKNIMVLSSPKSVSLKQSADSVELVHSTEYDLNTTNFDNLDDMFKTPVPNRFDDYNDNMEENNTPMESKDDNLKNLSPEEAFDNLIGQPSAIHTPVRKMYARKLLSNSSLLHKSPFSSTDIISDLPKTDIQEWVDSLENMELPENSEVEDITMTDVDGKEQCQDPLAASIVQGTDSILKINDTESSEILENTSTSNSIADPLACSAILSGEISLRRLAAAKESLTNAPDEAEISGIDLLVQSDDSMFSEPLVVSDSDTNLDKTLEEDEENTIKVKDTTEQTSTAAFSKLNEISDDATDQKCVTPHHFASLSKLTRRSLDAVDDLNVSVETEQVKNLQEKVSKDSEIKGEILTLEVDKIVAEDVENVSEKSPEKNSEISGSAVKGKPVEEKSVAEAALDLDSTKDQSKCEDELVAMDTKQTGTGLTETNIKETGQIEIDLAEIETEIDRTKTDLTKTYLTETDLIETYLTETNQTETEQLETNISSIFNEKTKELSISKDRTSKENLVNFLEHKNDLPKSTSTAKSEDIESPSEKSNNEAIIDISDSSESILLEDEPDCTVQTSRPELIGSENDAVSEELLLGSKVTKEQEFTDTEILDTLADTMESSEDQKSEEQHDISTPAKLGTESIKKTTEEASRDASNSVQDTILKVVLHDTETDASKICVTSKYDIETVDLLGTETTEEIAESTKTTEGTETIEEIAEDTKTIEDPATTEEIAADTETTESTETTEEIKENTKTTEGTETVEKTENAETVEVTEAEIKTAKDIETAEKAAETEIVTVGKTEKTGEAETNNKAVTTEIKENTSATSEESITAEVIKESTQNVSTSNAENKIDEDITSNKIEQNDPERSDNIQTKSTETTKISPTILAEELKYAHKEDIGKSDDQNESSIIEMINPLEEKINTDHQKIFSDNVEENSKSATKETFTKILPPIQPQDEHTKNIGEALQIDSVSVELAEQSICSPIEAEEKNVEIISQPNESSLPCKDNLSILKQNISNVLLVETRNENLDAKDLETSKVLSLNNAISVESKCLQAEISADSDVIIEATLQRSVSDIFLDTSDSENIHDEINKISKAESLVAGISKESECIQTAILEKSEVINETELRQSVADASALKSEPKKPDKSVEVSNTNTTSAVETSKDSQNNDNLADCEEILCNVALKPTKSNSSVSNTERDEEHTVKQDEAENAATKEKVNALVEDMSSNSKHKNKSEDIKSTPTTSIKSGSPADATVEQKQNIVLEHDFGHEITSEIYTTSTNQEELYQSAEDRSSSNNQLSSNNKNELSKLGIDTEKKYNTTSETEEINITQAAGSEIDTKDVFVESDVVILDDSSITTKDIPSSTLEKPSETLISKDMKITSPDEIEAKKCSSKLTEETCATNIQDITAERAPETSKSLNEKSLVGSSSSALETRDVEVEKDLTGHVLSNTEVVDEKDLIESTATLETNETGNKKEVAKNKAIIATEIGDEKTTVSSTTNDVQCIETKESLDALDDSSNLLVSSTDKAEATNELRAEEDVVKITDELKSEEIKKVGTNEQSTTGKNTRRRGAARGKIADLTSEELTKVDKETTTTRRGGRKKKEDPILSSQQDHQELESKNNVEDKIEGNIEEIAAEENAEQKESVKEHKRRGRKRKDLNAQHGTETEVEDEPVNKKAATDITAAEQVEEPAQQPLATAAGNVRKATYEIIVDHAEESPEKATPKRGRPRKEAPVVTSVQETDAHSLLSDAEPHTSTHSPVKATPIRGRPRKEAAVVTSVEESDENQDAHSALSDAEPHISTHPESSKQLQSDLKTSRGRTRKPTARAQQFLEEERAKAATPKRRHLLASVANSSTPTPTPTKMAARRGRKPSYIECDTEVPGSSTVAQQSVKRRGKGRKLSETHPAEQEEPSEETTSLNNKEKIAKQNKMENVIKTEQDEDDDKPVSHFVSKPTPQKLPARRGRKPTIYSEIVASITPQQPEVKQSSRGKKALTITKSESHSEQDEGTEQSNAAKSVTPEQPAVKRSGRGRKLLQTTKSESHSELDQCTEESDAIQDDVTPAQPSVKRSARGRKPSAMTKSGSHLELDQCMEESVAIKEAGDEKSCTNLDDDDKPVSHLINSSKLPARRGRKASTKESHILDSVTPQQIGKRRGRGRRVVAEVTTDETHSDVEQCAEDVDRINDSEIEKTVKPRGRGRKQAVKEEENIEEEVADIKQQVLLHHSPEPEKLPVRNRHKQAIIENEGKIGASPKQPVKRGGRPRKFTAETTSEQSHSELEQCTDELNALLKRNTAKPRVRRKATIEDVSDEKDVGLTSNPSSAKISTRRGGKTPTKTTHSDTTASVKSQQEEVKRGGRSRKVDVAETIISEQTQSELKHCQVESLDKPEDDKKKKAPSRARKHVASKTKHGEESDDDELIFKKFKTISNEEKLEVPVVATKRIPGRRGRTAATEDSKENENTVEICEINSETDEEKPKNTRNRRGANKSQTQKDELTLPATNEQRHTDDEDENDEEVKSEVTENDELEKPSTSTAASKKRHAAASRKGKTELKSETTDVPPVAKRGRRKAVTEDPIEDIATLPSAKAKGSRIRGAVTFESQSVANDIQPTTIEAAPKRATRTTRKK